MYDDTKKVKNDVNNIPKKHRLTQKIGDCNITEINIFNIGQQL